MSRVAKIVDFPDRRRKTANKRKSPRMKKTVTAAQSAETLAEERKQSWLLEEAGKALLPLEVSILQQLADGATEAEIEKKLRINAEKRGRTLRQLRLRLRANTNAHALAIAMRSGRVT